MPMSLCDSAGLGTDDTGHALLSVLAAATNSKGLTRRSLLEAEQKLKEPASSLRDALDDLETAGHVEVIDRDTGAIKIHTFCLCEFKILESRKTCSDLDLPEKSQRDSLVASATGLTKPRLSDAKLDVRGEAASEAKPNDFGSAEGAGKGERISCNNRVQKSANVIHGKRIVKMRKPVGGVRNSDSEVYLSKFYFMKICRAAGMRGVEGHPGLTAALKRWDATPDQIRWMMGEFADHPDWVKTGQQAWRVFVSRRAELERRLDAHERSLARAATRQAPVDGIIPGTLNTKMQQEMIQWLFSN